MCINTSGDTFMNDDLLNEYLDVENNKPIKKNISKVFTKILLSITLVLSILIYTNVNKSNKESVQKVFYDDVIPFYEFKNYTDKILFEILEYKLNKKGIKYSSEVSDNLSQYVIEMNNKDKKDHENGWLIEKDIIPEILEVQAERLSNMDNASDDDFVTLINSDIPVKNKKRSKEEIFASLDALVGLTDAKTQIRELMSSVEA